MCMGRVKVNCVYTKDNLYRELEHASGHFGNIYDKTSEAVQALGLDSECIGGGRIKHDAAAKKILVYGYSQGFGKADHEVTVSLLKKKYTDYNISWSDAGY
ncbi:14 kDa phosphohistidine phosphatase-like isoform X3 [Zootermopsis nevadensis]|uniref:14 kDa phosphohistidine phosphatase-like isoform X3 n=1 Tax=Zootermopsis nevadensis TaxID=136037 RepID=UPI000B8E805B|nr:14 kDa phosphohistidine phosphatase-like isoform X3 [Zootermopsis nevadensis]